MKYLGGDSESSGLFDFSKPADAPGQPRMAAIGMIFADDDMVETERHSFLIRPDGWTFDDHSEAAKVNGLTHERLMDEGVPAIQALEIYSAGIAERRIFVAHNASHDMKLLRAEMRIAGLPDMFMQTRHICTMWGSRAVVGALDARGKVKIPKLEEACMFFGIDPEMPGQHTAIGGAERALQILRCLRDRGALPDFKDPYEKGPRKAAARPSTWKRGAGPDYEREIGSNNDLDVDHSNFIGGANEDGK